MDNSPPANPVDISPDAVDQVVARLVAGIGSHDGTTAEMLRALRASLTAGALRITKLEQCIVTLENDYRMHPDSIELIMAALGRHPHEWKAR